MLTTNGNPCLAELASILPLWRRLALSAETNLVPLELSAVPHRDSTLVLTIL